MIDRMLTSEEVLTGKDRCNIGSPTVIDNFQMSDLWSVHWLRSLAGWNQTVGFWEGLAAAPSAEIYVVRLSGSVVGSASLWLYGRDLAWIGMVIVHPAYRGCRIGTGLLEHCLRRTDQLGMTTVGLDATPAGRGLYQQLGFVAGERLDRWEFNEVIRPNRAHEGNVSEVRSDERLDWPMVSTFDRDSSGLDRTPLLSMLESDCVRVRSAASATGDVQGYGCLRQGAVRSYLGPVLAESEAVGRDLVSSLLEGVGPEGAFWDIPADHATACATARRLGFSPVRPLHRMWRSDAVRAARSDRVWGIVDPALG